MWIAKFILEIKKSFDTSDLKMLGGPFQLVQNLKPARKLISHFCTYCYKYIRKALTIFENEKN